MEKVELVASKTKDTHAQILWSAVLGPWVRIDRKASFALEISTPLY